MHGGDYSILNRLGHPVIIVSSEGSVEFINRRLVRELPRFLARYVSFLLGRRVALGEILSLDRADILKIENFLIGEKSGGDDILFIKYSRGGYLCVSGIGGGRFAVEIFDFTSGELFRPASELLRGNRETGTQETAPMSAGTAPGGDRGFFEKIINDAADGFFIVDEDFRIIHHNKSFKDIFGDSDFSNADASLFDAARGEPRGSVRKKIQRVMRRQSSETAEIEIQGPLKSRYYLISLSPVRDAENRARQVCGFVKNITEIKLLQHQLEYERNYNRGIIESVNLGFALINDENQYLDYNDEYLAILGREKHELAGKTFYDFTAPRFVEDQKRLMREMIRTGRPYIYEKEIVRGDGSTVPVLVSMARLKDKEGRAIGSFAFIRDISDHKRIESQLLAQYQRVRNLINIYNGISAQLMGCETTDDVYGLLGGSLEKIWSPDALEVLSRRQEGFRTCYSYRGLTRGAESALDERVSMIVKMLADRKAPILIREVRTELNDEDFAVFPEIVGFASALFVPVLARGEMNAVVAMAFIAPVSAADEILMNIMLGILNLASITIEKILSIKEQELMRRALDRSERLTAMGRIIAGVAHEINNPLSIMQLDLDELRQYCADSREPERVVPVDIINSMQEEIARLSGIVKQLKDYSNPSTGTQEDVNIDEVLKTYPIKIFLKNLQKKGIDVRLKLDAGRSAVRIPRNRLIQVLMNLLSNADDAIADKARGRIVISTGAIRRNGNRVYVSIRDNGAGIRESDLQQIFEPFFTTKKSEGTGLGLSISYSIVKSHSGEIYVTNHEEGGVECIVYFPEARA